MFTLCEMREKKLTEKEASRPYAKYYYLPMTKEEPENLEILDKGPQDPSKALLFEDINKILDPGYLEVETGFCLLPDGLGYSAHHLSLGEVTPEMVDWWFGWHALEEMRYMLWCPPCHISAKVTEESRKKILDPNTPPTEKYMGITHYNIESAGFNQMLVNLTFLTPEQVGFDMEKYKASSITNLVAANIEEIEYDQREQETRKLVMIHTMRYAEDGKLEVRSRYYMGAQIVDGKLVRVIPEGAKYDINKCEGCCRHNNLEYTHLSHILPQLYKEMEGKIIDPDLL